MSELVAGRFSGWSTGARAQNPARGGGGPSAPNVPNSLSAALNRRKVETPIAQVQAQEALRSAQRLLRLAVQQG
eukprot:15451705-Alexandrium_andersonii.AAC.1